MGNGTGMEKAPPTGNPRPRPHFYLCGDGDEDDFRGRDGDVKAILGSALPRYHP